ncbi:MAG: FAD-dependent oxidoreductase, partial [Actinomycetia bacterium]|nr:FAD-dependent oxidoreductase [Actinomycetes bacterium]
FGPPHESIGWVRARTLELYGKHYAMAWPHEEHESARPLRRSPLYPALKKAGAVFGEKLGWERPNWFSSSGETARDIYSYGRQNWFEPVEAEHRATRQRVTLFDQSSFAKFLVSGVDAMDALSWMCSNHIDGPIGDLTYTQMLNERGGIECDVTVTRTGEHDFYIVTGTGFATHDLSWIRNAIPADSRATATDVTSAFATIAVMGPRTRDLLNELTAVDLSNEGFPFGTSRELTLGDVPIRALRVTYVGELGWELHVHTELASTLLERLMEVGADFEVSHAGYRAIESLRLEKGYLAWGKDIGPDHTPYEAGLGWAVKKNDHVDFLGKQALTTKGQRPLTKRLACFTVDDPDIVLLGRESIYRNGEPVGWLTSAGWGYTVEANIGYGYVGNQEGIDEEYLFGAEYELEVATELVSCVIHKGALYDPAMVRVRA